MGYSTILVSLEAGRSNQHVLAAAIDVADRFGAAVIGCAACTPIQILYADGYAFGDVIEQDNLEIARELAAAEAEFRDAMGAVRKQEWTSSVVLASLAGHVASRACRADLVLVAMSPEGVRNTARQVDLGELVMQAGRPVLLVAPAPVRMERVLVAWKDTREARRAVSSALPLLQRARHVSLVEIAEKDDLAAARGRLVDVAAWLLGHGVVGEIHARLRSEDDASGLAAVADELACDIVVAGAYGHSRVREWVLGGVTRDLLRHAVRPSLISH